jgi:hypothetical protein
MKVRMVVFGYGVLALLSVSFVAPSLAQTNSWTNSIDGFWQDASNWSLGVAPSTNGQSVILVTNATTKTITIDATTSGSFPGSMTVSNLIVSASIDSTNTLFLTGAGTLTPLSVFQTLSVSNGGVLRVARSALSIGTATDGVFSLDGNLIVISNGLVSATALYAGSDTNANTSILLSHGGSQSWLGGQMFLTNTQPSGVGINGSGQITVSNALLHTSSSFLFVGSGAGSQGGITVLGDNSLGAPAFGLLVVSPYGRLVVGMETGAVAAVQVGRGGELIITNSFGLLLGCDGSGELSLSNGSTYYDTNTTSILGPVEIGGDPGSQGTMTVAGGLNILQHAIVIASSPGATGTMWLTGGQIVQTNSYLVAGLTNYSPTYVGSWGAGLLTVSNGTWYGGSMVVGSDSNAQGTVNMEGGSMSLLSKLVIGNLTNASGVVNVNGGILNVTNAGGTASIVIGGPGHSTLHASICTWTNCSCVIPMSPGTGAGTLNQNGGTITVDRLILTNGTSSVYNLNAGTLQTKATAVMNVLFYVTCNGTSASTNAVTNSQTFVVGDGIQSATYRLLGGVHTFITTLQIRSNSFLTGCGTINGNVVVDPGATVLADCGGTLRFNGAFTNNGTLRAVNGTALESYETVVNNGFIDAIQGTTNFNAGVINNGIILDANGDYDGDGMSNLQEYLAGTDPTNSASMFGVTSLVPEGNDLLITWSAVTNKTYVVQVATNGPDGGYANGFSDLATVTVPASPVITQTNYLDVGAVTNGPSRFYRIRLGP